MEMRKFICWYWFLFSFFFLCDRASQLFAEWIRYEHVEIDWTNHCRKTQHTHTTKPWLLLIAHYQVFRAFKFHLFHFFMCSIYSLFSLFVLFTSLPPIDFGHVFDALSCVFKYANHFHMTRINWKLWYTYVSALLN